VVYLGEPSDRQRVGVEFLTPAQRFWGVELEGKAPAFDDDTSVH
jgi:hypothetical protein